MADFLSELISKTHTSHSEKHRTYVHILKTTAPTLAGGRGVLSVQKRTALQHMGSHASPPGILGVVNMVVKWDVQWVRNFAKNIHSTQKQKTQTLSSP